jgi:hypothetical protein
LTVASVSTGWVTRASAAKGVTFFMLKRDKLGLPMAANASAQRTGGSAWFAAHEYSPFAGNAAFLSASVNATKHFTLAQLSDHAVARHIGFVCLRVMVNTLHASWFTQCALRIANRWHTARMRAPGAEALGPVS